MENFAITIREGELKAKEVFERQQLEDVGKTYMDILPSYFKQKHYIAREFFRVLDEVQEKLNNCTLYKGRQFTKEELTRYAMAGYAYDRFHLARLYVPAVTASFLYMDFAVANRALRESDKDAYDKLIDDYLDNDPKYQEAQTIERYLRGMQQVWEDYEGRIAIKNRTAEVDMEKDGWPRQGRGNMCYAYHPVKGNIKDMLIGEEYVFTNPRSKKDVTVKILAQRPDDPMEYRGLMNGKEIYIAEYDTINNSWDALFSINKAKWSGWWNRTLILKTK